MPHLQGCCGLQISITILTPPLQNGLRVSKFCSEGAVSRIPGGGHSACTTSLWQHRAILGGFSTRANQMGPLRLHYVVHRYHHGVHFDPCKLLHHFADRRAHFHSHYVNLLGNGVVGTWMEERPLRAAVEAPTSARLDDEDDHFVLLSSVTQLLTTSVHLAISILGVRDQETREHLLVLSSGFRQNDIANNRTKFNPLQHS